VGKGGTKNVPSPQRLGRLCPPYELTTLHSIVSPPR
jgi:hypothetical protein